MNPLLRQRRPGLAILPAAIRLGSFAIAALASSALSAAQVDFNRDVRPILSDNCFACHGPDQNARKADLRFDVELLEVGAGFAV